jgi:hypothetical protein
MLEVVESKDRGVSQMKKLCVLAICFGCLTMGQAQAAEYLFSCMNAWNQEMQVRVEAETVNDARKMVKHDKEVLNKYSLDEHSPCSFRTELKLKGGKSKPMPKKEIPVTAGD